MIKPEMRMFLVLPQPLPPPNSNGVVNVNVLSVLMRCFLSPPSYLLPSFFFFCILLPYSFCPLPSWHHPPARALPPPYVPASTGPSVCQWTSQQGPCCWPPFCLPWHRLDYPLPRCQVDHRKERTIQQVVRQINRHHCAGFMKDQA